MMASMSCPSSGSSATPIDAPQATRLTVDPVGARDIADDRAGELFGFAAVIDRAGGDELVATEARDHGVFRHRVGQAAGDFCQHPIADHVAKRVVDFLESIEVEPEQRQLLVGRQLHLQFDQLVVESGAVEQSGDDVGAGLDAHLVGQFARWFRRR